MTDDDPAGRRSRVGWPLRTQETTTSAGTHDHSLPQGIFRVMIALSVFLIVLAVVDAVLVIYIVGRGEFRQRQIEQTRQDVREQLCDILDGLPQGGVLDLTRTNLGCGPGVPLDQLPPEIQQQLTPTPPQPTVTVVPAQPPVVPPAAPPSLAEPPAPNSPEPPPSGAEGPMSPAEPPPMSPPSLVRELVCDALPLCPEGTS